MKNLLQWGSEYIVSEKELPCMICGKPTKFVEIFFEARICCAKCQREAEKLIGDEDEDEDITSMGQ